MKISIRYLTLLLFVNIQLLEPIKANSVVSEITFDIFSQENGLPNNTIQCIYQDKKGWIWIGTSNGLSRFDGYSFVNFNADPTDSSSLFGNLVRVIKEDNNGNLLVGTENGGLNIYDREKERFSNPYRNHPEFISRDVSVNTIEIDKNGNYWIGTDFNVFKTDSLGTLLPFNPIFESPEMVFEGHFVRKLQFDNSGKLWIGTTQGVFIYNPLNNKIEPFDLAYKDEQNREIMELYLDDEGMIWIGTYSSGLFLVDPVSKKIETINLIPENNWSLTVRTISQGLSGDFWIGTRGGLYTYSKTRGNTAHYQHDERRPTSLSSNSLLYVFNGDWFDSMYGDQSKLTGASLQTNKSDFRRVNSQTKRVIDESKAAGKVWAVACDEPGDASHALITDGEDPEHFNARTNGLWGHMLAGGWGTEWYFGYNHPESDLTCQDYRSRDLFWDMGKICIDFFKENDLPVTEMTSQNELISSYFPSQTGDFCFAKQHDTYVILLKNGGESQLDLGEPLEDYLDLEETVAKYSVKWYDPRNGGELHDGSVTSIEGDGMKPLGKAPDNLDKDWVVLVRRIYN